MMMIKRLLPTLLPLAFAIPVNAAEFDLQRDPATDPLGAVAELLNAITTSQSNGEEDTILLFPGGVYTLSGNPILVEGLGATLLPVISEAMDLRIDGRGATIEKFSGVSHGRLMLIEQEARVVITDLTFKGGSLEPVPYGDARTVEVAGAGILNRGHLTLEQCRFENNSAGSWGGAVASSGESAVLKIKNSHFEGNHAHQTSGALDSKLAWLEIDGSTFIANTSNRSGGAIGISSPTVIRRSHFERNTAVMRGGAIHASNQVEIYDSTFIANETEHVGGAIANHLPNSNLLVVGSTFKENKSLHNGGAIDNFPGSLKVANSRFENNTSGELGGAIGTVGDTEIYQSEFLRNSTVASGGAIFNGQTIRIEKSQFEENSANEHGGAIYNENLQGGMVSGTIIDSVLRGNIADDNNDGVGDGGGLYIHGEQPFVVKETLIDENIDRSGEAPDTFGKIVTNGDNLILETEGSSSSHRQDFTGPLARRIIDAAE